MREQGLKPKCAREGPSLSPFTNPSSRSKEVYGLNPQHLQSTFDPGLTQNTEKIIKCLATQ